MTGSARPQYGHSKSPYSSRVIGRLHRAADVVALRIDWRGQVDDRVRPAENGGDPTLEGEPAHEPEDARR